MVKKKNNESILLLHCSAPRTGGSVGWAPGCHAGVQLRPDQHSGSLNNWGESAAFVITSANGLID